MIPIELSQSQQLILAAVAFVAALIIFLPQRHSFFSMLIAVFLVVLSLWLFDRSTDIETMYISGAGLALVGFFVYIHLTS